MYSCDASLKPHVSWSNIKAYVHIDPPLIHTWLITALMVRLKRYRWWGICDLVYPKLPDFGWLEERVFLLELATNV